jgi:hypothetical protein
MNENNLPQVTGTGSGLGKLDQVVLVGVRREPFQVVDTREDVSLDPKYLHSCVALEQPSAERVLCHETDDDHAILIIAESRREVMQNASAFAHPGTGDDDARS